MKKFFKYIIVGLSNIVPGICSASTAIILGVYEELLDIFSNIFKIKCLKKYFLYYLAIIMGIIIGVFGISYLYDIIPFILNIVFLGFILRGFPHKFDEMIKCSKIKYIIYFTIGFSIILLLNLLNSCVVEIDYDNLNFKTTIIVFINGLFTALAMILPGISGALLLVVLGLYIPLIDGVFSLITSITTFNFTNVQNFYLVIIFGLSFVFGLIFSSKVIGNIIKKRNSYFEPIINGLMMGSILNIILILFKMDYYLYERIIGIILFFIVVFYRKNK